MENKRVAYYNGKFVPESEAQISIYDSALMFGDMVFEMTRSFNKKQFKLHEHLERLYAGLKYFHIPEPMPLVEMEKAALETIARNEPYFAADDEHRLMIDVTRGLLPIYASQLPEAHKGPNVIIADYPLRWTVSSMGHLFETGVHAVIPSQRTIPASLLEPKVKNRSRVHYQMAHIEVAGQAGVDNWPLLLDPDGFIAEGSGYNFFIVKNNILITPEPRNILRGISRQYVMEELAPVLELDVVEKNIEPYDVVGADEAFITATPFCILPTTQLGGVAIGNGKVGPVVKALLQQWSKNVGIDIAQQIQGWASEAVNPYEFKK